MYAHVYRFNQPVTSAEDLNLVSAETDPRMDPVPVCLNSKRQSHKNDILHTKINGLHYESVSPVLI